MESHIKKGRELLRAIKMILPSINGQLKEAKNLSRLLLLAVGMGAICNLWRAQGS